MRTNTARAAADGAEGPRPSELRRARRVGARVPSLRAPRPDLDWNLLALLVTYVRG